MQSVFSTGRDIASITHLEVKYLLFFQGSETNVPTYFLSVLNTVQFPASTDENYFHFVENLQENNIRS